MSILEEKKRLAYWRLLLASKRRQELIDSLKEAPVVEIADFLEHRRLPVCISIFLALDLTVQANAFGHIRLKRQREIYRTLSKPVFISIFEHMHSDARADFYLKLNPNQQSELLPFLSKNVRKDVITLSGYPPEKIGSIMSTDFVAIGPDITIAEALEAIRKEPPVNKMMYYIYLVDKDKKLVGVASLKDLIIQAPTQKVAKVADETLIFAHLKDDKEHVANKIDKYNLMAIPVLNDQDQLVGIVNYDDAIDIIREETTEDIEKFMGIVPDEAGDAYLKLSSMQHFKKRIGWVTGLFVFGIFASVIAHGYEKLLTDLSFLAFYLTTISDTGGNVGSQAATMVIRAMALGQLSLKHWLKIIYKETKVALLVAGSLFVLCFLKVALLTSVWQRHNQELPPTFLIAFVIALTISVQVVLATLVGASLPLLMKKIGYDPALAASPAITTLVDIFGIFIYLGFASFFFAEYIPK